MNWRSKKPPVDGPDGMPPPVEEGSRANSCPSGEARLGGIWEYGLVPTSAGGWLPARTV
jgi:hypothetical protein